MTHSNESIDQRSANFVEAVLLRPRMYTLEGTLEEVGAFLEGFYTGMAAHNRSEAAQRESQYWFDFCAWAAKEVGVPEGGNWYTLFQNLKQHYAAQSDAFINLIALYSRFRKENLI
ncbi:MAG: hypothetical protein HC828_05885 [Blastochloris sp.]|nr:hypothetical protein [Blastochloris sp.]